MMADTNGEQAVLEQVPKRPVHRREWRAASGGGTLAVEDPSTGEPLVEVADGAAQDALAALGAAAEKQAEWARIGAARARARSCAGRTRRSSRRPTSWRC